jgi:hypothetical protein
VMAQDETDKMLQHPCFSKRQAFSPHQAIPRPARGLTSPLALLSSKVMTIDRVDRGCLQLVAPDVLR